MKKVLINSLILFVLCAPVFSQWTYIYHFSYPLISNISVHNPSQGVAYLLDDSYVIHKTSNDATSWTQQNIGYSGQPLNSIYFIDNNNGFAVGVGGTILKTTNGGTSWTETLSDNGEDLYNIYFLSSSTGFTCGDEMLKTTDGGVSWNEVNIHNNNQMSTIYDICFLTSTFGYAVGGDGFICQTTDGGNNWYGLYKGTYDFHAVHEINSTTLIIGGDMGAIYRSSDSGTSWQNMSGSYTGITDIEFVNSTVGHMTTEGGYIYKSTDGGLNWNAVENGGEIMHCVSFCDENNGYAVGMNGSTYNTNNGGTSYSVYSLPQDKLKMYPNPSSGKVYFETVAEKDEEIVIEVSNICGSLVEIVKLNSGTPNYWNTEHLSNGLYNVKINCEGITWNRKLVIAK